MYPFREHTGRPRQVAGGSVYRTPNCCRTGRRRRLFAESLEPRNLLATIAVTTFDDVLDANDGVLSLREAVIESRNSAGADEIVLQSGVYQLTRVGEENAGLAGDLDVTNGQLTIRGAGQDLTTIDATGMGDRVLHVHAANDTLVLRDLTVAGGNRPGSSFSGSGAGIYTNGQLSIENVTLRDNNAGDDGGAIYTKNLGQLTASNSSFVNNSAAVNGGAIFFDSSVSHSIDVSTFVDNDATNGGAIFVLGGALDLSGSTIASNTASGSGGGVAQQNSDVNSVNSTFSGNHAGSGGAIRSVSGTLNISSNTITQNQASVSGGGLSIAAAADVVAQNSIVAGNIGVDVAGNLSGASNFNIVGIDSALQPLADNGGPTLTHALDADSPAIDAGRSFGVSTDQRGQPRPFDSPLFGNAIGGDGSDIGAVEFQDPRFVLASSSQSLLFSTQDQSMWGPGSAFASAEFEFRHTLVDESEPAVHLGGFAEIVNPEFEVYDAIKTTEVAACRALLPNQLGLDGNCGTYVVNGATIPVQAVPNPARVVWQAAYDSCADLFFQDLINTCRDLLGSAPPASLFFGPFTIDGIGAPPPETLRNGAELVLDGALEVGFSAQLEVSSGKVEVDYPTEATIQIVGVTYEQGSQLQIRTSELAGNATMSTEFSTIDASLSGFLDTSLSADLEVAVLGDTVVDDGFAIDTGPTTQELVSTHIETNNFQVEFFDYAELEVQPEPFGQNLNIPALPPPFDQFLGYPLADAQIYFPELSTPDEAAGNTSTFDGDQIVNTQLPVVRTGSGETSIDFFKFDVDLDALFTVPNPTLPILGVELGDSTFVSAEINIADIDYGAFLGLGQTMTFDPLFTVDLNFSVPTPVETSPGSGVYESVSQKSINVGDDLNIIHPGGEFQIDPVYRIDGSTFSNDSNFYVSPVTTVAFAQVIPGGLLSNLLGIDEDYHLSQETIPDGQPIPIGQVGDPTPFVMEGFAQRPASTITVPGESAPPVITSVILGSGDPADDASGWSQAFIDTVDGEGQGAGNALGYEVIAGGRSIPWNDVDRIYIQFSEDVGDVTADQVMLLGGITSDYSDQISISYDPPNARAIIVSDSPLPLDKFRLALSDSISLESNTSLDGDADGSPGGIFQVRFDIVPGDGNDDGKVSIGDIGVFGAAFNSQPGGSRYDPFADWNTDDSVSIGDIGAFGANFNKDISDVAEPPEANFGFESQGSGSTENLYAADLLFTLLSNSDDAQSSPHGLPNSNPRDDAGLF